MANWVLDKFLGIAPKVPLRRLADGMGEIANNMDTNSQRLEPLRFPKDLNIAGGANTQSFHLYNDTYYFSDNEQRYVETFQPDDADDKLYFTDYPSYPKIRSGAQTTRLGLPIPEAPTVAVVDAGDDSDETLNETWIYTYTFVDVFGFEGPSSPPSLRLTVGRGATASIQIPAPPNRAGLVIDKMYLYRSNAGSEAGAFQFVREISLAQAAQSLVTPINDSVLSSSLEEVLTASDNYAPPDETNLDGALRGLVSVPGAVLAGHTKKAVYVTKPGQPHAWPYVYQIPETIVGIATVPSGILVLTEGSPYMLFGASPEALVLDRIPSEQGCLSAESICRVDNALFYASHDGLCRYSNGDILVVTQALMGRNSWNALFEPRGIRAFAYEGKYIAFNTLTGRHFIYDPFGEQASLTTFEYPHTILASYRDDAQDRTLVLVDVDGAERVMQWGEGATDVAQWKSGERQFPRPVGFSYFKIYGPQEARVQVELTVYPLNNPIRFEAQTNTLMRLPIRTKHRLWQIKLTTQVPIEIVVLADNPGEVI